ncbi:MAG: hypothetical protein IT270_20660 [Saprospiraceae bacterium]|nr:hypothetical protein [Saprospiraceae bacterium]
MLAPLRITLALLILFLASTVWSQKKAHPTSFELGYDLLWLIDKNTYPSTSLFGRYHFDQTEDKGKALRLRLGATFHRPDSTVNDLYYYFDSYEYSLYIQPGLEWQRKFGRLDWVFGFDVPYAYQFLETHYKYRYQYQNIDELFIYEVFEKGHKIGVSPLTGLRLHLGNRFFLYLETSIDASYLHYRLKEYVQYANTYPPSFYTDPHQRLYRDDFQVVFNPIKTLMISFSF